MRVRSNTNTFISTATLKCPKCKSAHALCKCDKFVTQRCKVGGLLWQDIIYVLVACKKDTGLVNVLIHIIVSNVTNTTILFYIRIAGSGCRRLLRLKQILQGLRKRVRLLQNQDKEATVVLRNSVHLKLYLPLPQSRSQTDGVLNNLAEVYLTESHNQAILLKPLYRDCNWSVGAMKCLLLALTTRVQQLLIAWTLSSVLRTVSFILPNLTGNMPSSVIDITTLKLHKGITLANDEFNIPGRIDMLIGSDLYPYLRYSKYN